VAVDLAEVTVDLGAKEAPGHRVLKQYPLQVSHTEVVEPVVDIFQAEVLLAAAVAVQ
jgi:hypothetical protein